MGSFGDCLSLHLKTITWGSASKSQVPSEPRKVPPCGRPCGDDPACAVTLCSSNPCDESVADQCPDSGTIQELCFGF